MGKKKEKKLKKQEKKAKKKAKKQARKEKKKVIKSVPNKTVLAADQSATARKLIHEVDKLEEQIANAKDRIQEIFPQLVEALGSASFEHPEKGEWTVAVRNDVYHWRKKPMSR